MCGFKGHPDGKKFLPIIRKTKRKKITGLLSMRERKTDRESRLTTIAKSVVTTFDRNFLFCTYQAIRNNVSRYARILSGTLAEELECLPMS